MFVGHFAVGFASKRFAPRTNLAPLIAAPMLLDILWPFFLLVGWEQVLIEPGNTRYTPLNLIHYPWSHSLLMSAVWATAFAGVYYAYGRYKAGALAIWIGVISHWVLDWITHRPDMPLYPAGPRLGLGLWNSVAGTMIVELVLFGIGLWLYVSATRAKDRIGTYAFLTYVLTLLVFYIGDRFGGPPGSVGEIVWTAIIAEPILIFWPWWFDRHRDLR